MTTRHWGAVWKDARFAPWTKYSDSEIAQLAALRRLYQKHFDCTLEVVEPMKKDKKRAAQNVATGAAVGGVVGGVAGEVSSMATPAVLVPGVAHGQAMLGAGAGAMVGGGVMAAREAAKPVPDHPQEQLWRGGVEQLLLVDKKGYPVLKEATANEKLQNMGAIVSSNSLAYNVNTVLLHMQRYIHHDRVHGLLKRMAFSPNDPRCIFCMILVEWLHKVRLRPCPAPRATCLDQPPCDSTTRPTPPTALCTPVQAWASLSNTPFPPLNPPPPQNAPSFFSPLFP